MFFVIHCRNGIIIYIIAGWSVENYMAPGEIKKNPETIVRNRLKTVTESSKRREG